MGIITLPANLEQDRQNGIKASSVHVQGNFDTLLAAVNKKLENDGSIVPVADLPMGNNRITGLAAPSTGGDATNKTYVDNALALKANLASPTFTGTPQAPTAANNKWDGQIATTGFVKSVLSAIWPVYSVYIGTQSTCPLAAFFGTWTLVSSGKALWTGNGTNGGTTIDAGLPNITGSFSTRDSGGTYYDGETWNTKTGSFSGNTGTYNHVQASSAGGWGPHEGVLTFDASKSNPIYGNSSTVQPPAYVVNVWLRTA